jgi:hypothetical protein
MEYDRSFPKWCFACVFLSILLTCSSWANGIPEKVHAFREALRGMPDDSDRSTIAALVEYRELVATGPACLDAVITAMEDEPRISLVACAVTGLPEEMEGYRTWLAWWNKGPFGDSHRFKWGTESIKRAVKHGQPTGPGSEAFLTMRSLGTPALVYFDQPRARGDRLLAVAEGIVRSTSPGYPGVDIVPFPDRDAWDAWWTKWGDRYTIPWPEFRPAIWRDPGRSQAIGMIEDDGLNFRGAYCGKGYNVFFDWPGGIPADATGIYGGEVVCAAGFWPGGGAAFPRPGMVYCLLEKEHASLVYYSAPVQTISGTTMKAEPTAPSRARFPVGDKFIKYALPVDLITVRAADAPPDSHPWHCPAWVGTGLSNDKRFAYRILVRKGDYMPLEFERTVASATARSATP